MRNLLKRVQQTAEEALLRANQAAGGGGLEPVPVQLRYVAPSGSDANGNGSFAQPFATISHAESVITDAGALKPYSIQVAPGIYPEAISMKSFVSICGIDPSAPPRLDGILSFAVGSVGGFGLANLEITAVQTLVLPATDPTFDIVHCQLDSAFSITGAAGGSSLTVEQNTFKGVTTFTDIGSLFSEGNTYFGSDSFVAAAVSGTVNSNSDTFRSNLAVTATAPFLITANLVGSQVQGGLTLTGAGVTFRGTAGAIPPAVTLAGGASAPTLWSSANGLAYTATTVGNWSGTNPTSIQNALDRIAAHTGPIP